MKKAIITFLTALAYIHAMQAQTIDGEIDFGTSPYKSSLAVPREFCYGESPLLVLYSNSGKTVNLYDENIDLVKSIDLKDDFTYDYSLTYQTEQRQVLSINEIYKSTGNTWNSYESFIREQTDLSNGANLEESFVIKELENGDKIISVDYSKLQNTFDQTNEERYFAFEQYAFKYPYTYFYVQKDGPVTTYNTHYKVSYSDWEITGTHQVPSSKKVDRIALVNVNLNLSDVNNESRYFEVSQTLFNDDSKFEYLIPKYKLSKYGSSGPSSDVVVDPAFPWDTELKLTRSTLVSELSLLALSGFQVISEDGAIIQDLDFDSDFVGNLDYNNVYVVTIGKNTYLAFRGTKNGNDCTVFYKIDRTTSSIQQAKSVPAALMQIVPTVAKSGSEINVNFGDDNKDGSQIEVISASGAKVKSMNVPAGQKSAQFSVHGASGLYCVSRVQKNQPRETKKIIIK